MNYNSHSNLNRMFNVPIPVNKYTLNQSIIKRGGYLETLETEVNSSVVRLVLWNEKVVGVVSFDFAQD